MNVTKKMKMNDGTEISTAATMDSLDTTTASSRREPDTDAIKMFAGQIPRSKTEEDLMEMFKEFGDIYTLNVLRDKNTGLSKGCCFLTYYTRAAALAAQNALHNMKTLPGMQHPIQMKPADTEKKNVTPENYSSEERKLFVGMISKTTTDDDLKIMFAPYGVIEDCTVLRDSQNNHKGCAFVTFSTRSSAQQAALNLHNSSTMEGCSSSIVVKFAYTQKEKETKRNSMLMNAASKNGMGVMGMGSPYLPLMPNAPQHNNMPNMGNLSNLAGSTGLSPLAIQNLITAATNNSNPVLNQLLKAANPVPNNNNPNVSNIQQVQNLQTLSALFSAAAANQAGNLNPYGAQNIAALNQMASPPSNNMGNMNNSNAHNVPNMGGGGPQMAGAPPLLSGMQGQGMQGQGMQGQAMQGQAMQGQAMQHQNGMGASQGMAGQHQGNNMETLNQAYAGMQQYAAAFPNAFNTQNNTQLQQMTQNVPAGKDVEGPEGCNLFIYHLPPEFVDQDLYLTFATFGNVISAKVFIDKQTSLSKCFGFVSYDNPTAASSAIQSMNGFQVGTKRLKVQLKRSKSESKPY